MEEVEARRRESEILDSLVCPKCGRTLLLISGGCAISFYCKSGHDWPLPDLLAIPSPPLKHGLRAILQEWERQVEIFRYTASQALLGGHADVSEMFRREAGNLDGRIQILREALTKSEATAVVEEFSKVYLPHE